MDPLALASLCSLILTGPFISYRSNFLTFSAWSVLRTDFLLGSAIKNMGLFSKIPIDFKIETMDF